MIKVPCKRGTSSYPALPEESIPLLPPIASEFGRGELRRMNGNNGPGPGAHKPPATGTRGANMSDTRAKNILIEAVDAVVNSFAKHTYGYGRGEQ